MHQYETYNLTEWITCFYHISIGCLSSDRNFALKMHSFMSGNCTCIELKISFMIFPNWSNSQHSNFRDQTTLSPTARVFESFWQNNQLFVVKLRCSSKLSPSILVRLSAWAPNIFFRHFFGFSHGAIPAPESFSDWFYEKLPRALVKFCWATKSLILNSLGYTSVAKRSSGRHFWLLKCSSPITYTDDGAGDAEPQEFTPE